MPRSNAALASPPACLAAEEGCEIDTDKARLDLAMIHGFLVRSHWAAGIPFAVMQRAIESSLAFGLYRGARQIGFARVVTDHATFAYLADVFVVEAERGKGLGRHLVDTILAHPDLQGLRRWLLGTRDAQSLYRRCGFAEPPAPFTFLERLDGGVYHRNPLPAGEAPFKNPLPPGEAPFKNPLPPGEGRVRVAAASQRPTAKPRRRPSP